MVSFSTIDSMFDSMRCAAGAIAAEGTPEALKSSPIVEQLYFGAAPTEAAHA